MISSINPVYPLVSTQSPIFTLFLKDRMIPAIPFASAPCSARPITRPETPAPAINVLSVLSRFSTPSARNIPTSTTNTASALPISFVIDC